MAQGFKSGGRRKGIPNKRTGSLVERLLEDLKCDPVGIAASIANDPKAGRALRLKAAMGLMEYVYPKRRAAVDLSSDDAEPAVRGIVWVKPSKPSALETTS